jgi:hypothetical protein
MVDKTGRVNATKESIRQGTPVGHIRVRVAAHISSISENPMCRVKQRHAVQEDADVAVTGHVEDTVRESEINGPSGVTFHKPHGLVGDR